jgi:hypothetical protein
VGVWALATSAANHAVVAGGISQHLQSTPRLMPQAFVLIGGESPSNSKPRIMRDRDQFHFFKLFEISKAATPI